MISELIDKMVDEKIDCNEYREWADETEDEELKEILESIADQEHEHYKKLKEYLKRFINE